MYFKPRVSVWFLTLILSVLGAGCSREFDLESESDRKALKQEIRNALTNGNCDEAVELSTPLYNSKYTENEVRYLFASAHACRFGVNFFGLLEGLANGSLSAAGFWETAVSLFPSRTALDTKFQSAAIAQDALQAMLTSPTIVSAADKTYADSYNPGSVWYRDRQGEANTLLFFVSLGNIGTGLNRYGFLSTENPADTNYQQTVKLPWIDYLVAPAPNLPFSLWGVRDDASGAACQVASAVLNLLDGLHGMEETSTGTVAETVNTILTSIEGPMLAGAQATCLMLQMADPAAAVPSAQQCAEAVLRLRFRSACTEDDKIAMAAVGILLGIDGSWIGAGVP